MKKLMLGVSIAASVAVSILSSVVAVAQPRMINVGYLSELKGDTTCQGTGGIMTYAETKNYRVYICADKNDRSQPRYYRSRDRVGKGGLNLEARSYDPRQLRYFEFRNQGYTYILQMPLAQIPNPNLSVEFPNGRIVEEPVLRYLAR